MPSTDEDDLLLDLVKMSSALQLSIHQTLSSRPEAKAVTAESAENAEQTGIKAQNKRPEVLSMRTPRASRPNTETRNSPRTLRSLRLKPSPAGAESFALVRVAKARVLEQQVLGVNHRLVFGEDQRPFDHVLQFANVSRPRLRLQQL